MNFMHKETTAYRPLPEFIRSGSKDDIKKLLERSEATLEKEGVLDQIIALSDWLESVDPNSKGCQDGMACLQEVRKRLSQRADDLIRLEGEGGLPATPKQELEIAELTRAVKRIDHMIGLLEGRDVF